MCTGTPEHYEHTVRGGVCNGPTLVLGVGERLRNMHGRLQHFPRYHPVGPARYRSPRHRMPFDSRNEDSERVWMTWRAMGLAYIARHGT